MKTEKNTEIKMLNADTSIRIPDVLALIKLILMYDTTLYQYITLMSC